MSGYVHFTDEQKDRARQTDIVSLLERQGEKVRRAGSEYEWLDGTAKVSIRGNLWFHQYEREGGNAIDFVKRSTTGSGKNTMSRTIIPLL